MVTRSVPLVANSVFVITAFGSDLSAESCACIRTECERLGLSVARADDHAGSGSIIHEIRTDILKAEFLIVDLSEERPNVYYELGYAHGTNNGPLD